MLLAGAMDAANNFAHHPQGKEQASFSLTHAALPAFSFSRLQAKQEDWQGRSLHQPLLAPPVDPVGKFSLSTQDSMEIWNMHYILPFLAILQGACPGVRNCCHLLSDKCINNNGIYMIHGNLYHSLLSPCPWGIKETTHFSISTLTHCNVGTAVLPSSGHPSF